jgi:hypothetical protein
VRKLFVIALLLLAAFSSIPASAQLQYFGYVGGADDDVSLGKTKGYTNFAHISTSSYISDPFVSSRVTALAQRGSKAMIDLGYVFWCDYSGTGQYREVCWDWYSRWTQWKSYNAAILTADKVLAFDIRDQPFNFDVSMADYEMLAAQVKAAFPWAKLYMVDDACVIANDNCGWHAGAGAFASYGGTLPNIDWIGIYDSGIHPATDSTYQYALSLMRWRFPTKKWLYVMDGTTDSTGAVTNEWYNVAHSDANAVLLGVFDWASSQSFACSTLALHVAVGRAITGKARPHAGVPLGSFSIDTNGGVTGWACDPDETVCEHPRVDLDINGIFTGTATYNSPLDSFANAQCGTERAYRYHYNSLPRSSAGKTITVFGTDADAGVGQSASTCPGSPSCTWTPHLQYYGYVGGADYDLALSQTNGYTNFAQISTTANPMDTFVRDRVTALAQKGSKAVIALDLVLWCDYDGNGSYRYLCGDWLSRWTQWKNTNASILTASKVLAFSIRDEPFHHQVLMDRFETASAQVKADLPWAKLYVVDGACEIVDNGCGSTPTGSFNAYHGTLPNIDWIGVDDYAIHPATDPTFQYAVSLMKMRFPTKQWLYILDGWWSDAYPAAFGSQDQMGAVALEWYNVAHADFSSVLLGVFGWDTYSKSYPCSALSQQVAIGREVTGKVRPQTASPVGLLEQIDYTGTAIGYACDPDGTVCENPQVDFFLNGSPNASGTGYYPDAHTDYVFDARCGSGVANRFRSNVWWASGSLLTAYARDLDSGVRFQLPSNCVNNPACLWYSTTYAPKGYMETISPSGVAAGWVCDPDAPQVASKVRLALANGTQIGVYTTNLASEQAVADECRGGYLHRFSVQLPASARYQNVYAYAQDFVWGETQIPWLCPNGWYCVSN